MYFSAQAQLALVRTSEKSGGGVGSQVRLLAAVECHADHLGDLGAGDVALGLERAVG